MTILNICIVLMDDINDTMIKEFTYTFNNLNINKCYTFCMKYTDYHPFIENLHYNNNKLILLQTVNIAKFNLNSKLEINESEEIASRYYVSLLPTVLMFTNEGKLAKRLSGLSNKKFLIMILKFIFLNNKF